MLKAHRGACAYPTAAIELTTSATQRRPRDGACSAHTAFTEARGTDIPALRTSRFRQHALTRFRQHALTCDRASRTQRAQRVRKASGNPFLKLRPVHKQKQEHFVIVEHSGVHVIVAESPTVGAVKFRNGFPPDGIAVMLRHGCAPLARALRAACRANRTRRVRHNATGTPGKRPFEVPPVPKAVVAPREVGDRPSRHVACVLLSPTLRGTPRRLAARAHRS